MVRVRFAPSPTGELHIGNAWTALINFVFSVKKKGTFLLRIEDTDRERSSRRYEFSILEDLEWLGISFYGRPVRQSERLPIYRELALNLVRKGMAYKCFCAKEMLERERVDLLEKGGVYRYTGRCRNLSSATVRMMERQRRPYAVRFRAPKMSFRVEDLIKGPVVFPEDHVDDFVILREDLTPTFNFACAVDDMLMGITHVIRGQDHLPNTPKQAMILLAFQERLPYYAHHPLLLGEDGRPLSKRHGVTSIRELREMGLLREAVVEYLLSLSTGERKRSLTEDPFSSFCLSSLSGSDLRFDMEKLLSVNAVHLRSLSAHAIASSLQLPSAEEEMVEVVKENARTLKEVTSLLEIFHSDRVEPDAFAYLASKPELRTILAALDAQLENKELRLEVLVQELERVTSLGRRELLLILRAVMTGRLAGPPLEKVFPLLDRAVLRERITCLKKSL